MAFSSAPPRRFVNRPLVLGTRGSALAFAQVELVKQALHNVNPAFVVGVKKITTAGDSKQDVRAAMESGAGLKGMFTKEIEDVLLAGVVDAAVHSLKDLPGHTPAGLEIAAVLARADTADLLIVKSAHSFSGLPEGAHIATSSVRRKRQLLWMRPDLQVEEIRGNVPTRLKKLRASENLDAIVLAKAGIDRLGINLATENFHVDVLKTLPAIGQGAIALECRSDDAEIKTLLAKINHAPTFQCIRAERELLRLLNGDCNLPVGVETRLDGHRMTMRAIVFGEENEPPLVGEAECAANAPEELAEKLFRKIYVK